MGQFIWSAAMGRRNLAILQEQYPNLPIVFLEPSCLSMFIDDYLQLRLPGAAEVARRCVTFEAFADRAIAGGRLELRAFLKLDGDTLDRTGGVNLAIHAHCHAKALTDVTVLKRIAQRIPNASVTLLDTACCGMAGAYGMSACRSGSV